MTAKPPLRKEYVKILVVDDTAAMRLRMKTVLGQMGFMGVTTVGDGEHGKGQVTSNKFHLILCDWQMPIMSGINFLKFVREQPEAKGTIFMMVTSEAAPEKVKEAIQAGVNGYIVKPYTDKDISTKIKAALKGVLVEEELNRIPILETQE